MFCRVLKSRFFPLICAKVERLNALVPELLNRLKVVENKKPVNNVTTNIVRIRELIAQARSVAKKVSLPLRLWLMKSSQKAWRKRLISSRDSRLH